MRTSRPSAADVIPITVLVLLAVAYTYDVIWKGRVNGAGASFDIYAAHFPNVVYALRSHALGHGLLWTSLQNCGQPFLPSTLAAPLYPLHLLFLLIDVDTGFLLIAGLHLMLAGVFAYWWCREIGLGRTASLCGGLAFMLGGSTLGLVNWLPTVIFAPYVWLPAALAMTERILAKSGWANAVGLATCLTLGILAGYPQITFFTYQLIGLRVAWALCTVPRTRRARVLRDVAIGCGLPVFLGAAYLLPSLEFAARSVRSLPLTPYDISPPLSRVTWAAFSKGGGFNHGWLPVLTLIATMLSVFSLTSGAYRRLAVFWGCCTILYLALAYWPPLLSIYMRLPLGRTFRAPGRFVWVASAAFSVSVALGVEAIGRSVVPSKTRVGLLAATMAFGLGVFKLVATRPFLWWEPPLLVLLVATVLTSALRSGVASRVVLLVPLVLAADLFLAGARPFERQLLDGSVMYANEPAFRWLGAHMTPLDRMYGIGSSASPGRFALTYKSASLFGIRSIVDYEPQTSRRYATFTVRMLDGWEMRSLNDFYHPFHVVPERWPLFHLVGAHYLVADDRGLRSQTVMPSFLRPVWTREHIHIWSNENALPRAFYVPRLEVVSSADAVLARLESPSHDPRQAALVEQPPADGFLGSDPPGSGTVSAVVDESERLVVRVAASRRGFLFISDQDYPGWEATVNDAPAPIVTANYAFRVVPVPAGESEVVFRYRPRSVRLGAGISLASLALLLAARIHGRSSV